MKTNNNKNQNNPIQKDIDLDIFHQSLQQLFFSDQQQDLKIAVSFLENNDQLNKGLYYQSIRKEINDMDKLMGPQVKYQRVSQLVTFLMNSQLMDPSFIKIVFKIMRDLYKDQEQQNYIDFMQQFKGQIMKQFLIKLQVNQKYDDLIEMLLIFQDKQYEDIIDIRQLIKYLFQKQKKSKQLIQLLKIYDSFIDTTIKAFNNNQYCSIIGDIIKYFNYDIKDHPQVLERLQKKFIRYYINNYNWMRTEQALFQHPQMLAFALEDMLYKKQYNEVFSINERQNLLQRGYIRKIETQQFLQTFDEKNQYLENLLYKLDGFANTERVINENDINMDMKITVKQQIEDDKNYLFFEDFNIQEANVHFIDNVQDTSFKYSINEILKSQIIGLDTEFTNNFTKFDQQEIAVMQLSNEREVFVFDVIQLKKEKQFRQFLKAFLESDKILKLGHSLRCDLQQINNTFKSYEQLNFLNYIDIAKVYRHQFPADNRYALSHIVKQILNKEFSKLEQCSNWEQRPLRKAQLHYAALDAYVCVVLYQKLTKIFQDNKQMDNLEFFIENSYCNNESNHESKKDQQQSQQKQCNDLQNQKELQQKQEENSDQNIQINNQSSLSQYLKNNKVQLLFDNSKYFCRLNYYLNNLQFEFIQEHKLYKEQQPIVQYAQDNKYVIITKCFDTYNQVNDVPIIEVMKNDLQNQISQIQDLKQMLQKVNIEQ